MTYDCETMETCHEHVKECRDNPHPGAIYGDYVYWLQRHVPNKRRHRINDTVHRFHHQVFGGIHASIRDSLRNLE